jgi:PAS domain S-box-containing protein
MRKERTTLTPRIKLIPLFIVAFALFGSAQTWSSRWLDAFGFFALTALAIQVTRTVSGLNERTVWLEGTLDAVPQPITVTDMNMRWIFVNKVTEGLLQRTREEVKGRHCSEWKADICGTDKCGIRSLRGGCPQTKYMQNMPDGKQRSMQVDTSYIHDRAGRRIGHVEIVTDIHTSHELQGIYTNIASSLEEMSSSMVELDAQTKSNAASAKEASKQANSSRQTIEDGTRQMEQLTSAMKQSRETSQSILKINKVIDEIAFQTNILALNAAVEAARAGHAGSGFAVVAEEVRRLAARVSKAAKETSELIAASSASVERGGALASSVADFLTEVHGSSSKIDSLLAEIARSSTEQSQGLSMVTQALNQLEQTTISRAL